MWSGVVVLPEPVFDDNLGLFRYGEPFGIEDLPAEGSVEPFIVSVFPCTARQGIAWRCPETGDPG